MLRIVETSWGGGASVGSGPLSGIAGLPFPRRLAGLGTSINSTSTVHTRRYRSKVYDGAPISAGDWYLMSQQ